MMRLTCFEETMEFSLITLKLANINLAREKSDKKWWDREGDIGRKRLVRFMKTY